MSQNTYLHEINGGFDNNLRREVRKLFQGVKQDSNPAEMPEIVDLVVGVLEEFHYIGIKEFTLDQVMRTLDIFGFTDLVTEETAIQTLEHPRVSVYMSGEVMYQLPELDRIEALKAAYCTEKAKESRMPKPSRL